VATASVIYRLRNTYFPRPNGGRPECRWPNFSCVLVQFIKSPITSWSQFAQSHKPPMIMLKTKKVNIMLPITFAITWLKGIGGGGGGFGSSASGWSPWDILIWLSTWSFCISRICPWRFMDNWFSLLFWRPIRISGSILMTDFSKHNQILKSFYSQEARLNVAQYAYGVRTNRGGRMNTCLNYCSPCCWWPRPACPDRPRQRKPSRSINEADRDDGYLGIYFVYKTCTKETK